MYAFKSLLKRGGHNDAFTGGKSVRLNYYRSADAANILLTGSFIGKRLPCRSRHPRLFHNALGKRFRALHLSGFFTWTKAGHTGSSHRIGNAFYQRSFRADNYKSKTFLTSKCRNCLGVILINVNRFGHCNHAAVTGSNIYLSCVWRLTELG